MIYYYDNQIGRVNESMPVFAKRKYLNIMYHALHWHEYYEIELWLSGKANSSINGEKRELEKGTVYFLCSTDFHDIDISGDEKPEIIHVCIDRSVLEFELIEKIHASAGNLFFKLNDEEFEKIYTLLSIIVDECAKEEAYKKMYVKNILEAVIILLLRKNKQLVTEQKHGQPYILKATSYLRLNFRQNPSLEEVAAFVGLNKNYFCALFRNEMGVGMHTYLNDLKLKYAKKLIESTELPLFDICKNCGFNSYANFNNSFKQKYGRAPLKYRKDT